MFRFVAVLALAALPAGAAAQAEQPAAQKPAATDAGGFANETEKGSYAVGYDLGGCCRTEGWMWAWSR